MKKFVFFFILLASVFSAQSQNTYVVNNETLQLKTEVNGPLVLLWNIIDDQYRYFIKKDSQIIELKNTRGDDNKYQEEYKQVLNDLTQGSNLTKADVNLTLPSLIEFVNTYNSQVDSNFTSENKKATIGAKLLAFGGISNSPFVINPNNVSNPIIGAEIEVFGTKSLPRHSIFLHLKHTFSSNDFEYSNTQIGLGYRFRFIKSEAFNLYANVTMATYGFIEKEVMIEDELVKISTNDFDAPIIFGIGADIKVSKNGYITVLYDELFAIALDNEGNFSTHIAVGYKFNL